jgi:hypothetical protein
VEDRGNKDAPEEAHAGAEDVGMWRREIRRMAAH